MTARSTMVLLLGAVSVACGDDGMISADDSSTGTDGSTGSTGTGIASSGSESSSEGSDGGQDVPLPSAECGNGILEFGEDCDDGGDGDPDDGCTDACSVPTCGDGYVQKSLGEACDAGPDGDTFCGTDCTSRLTLEWLHKYGGDNESQDDALGVAIDAEGNIYAVGSVATTVLDAFGFDIWVRKYDPSGREVWTRTHDSGTGASNDEGFDVAVDDAGNVYVAGAVPVTGEVYDGIVLAYDADGDLRWTVMHQGAAHRRDEIAAVAVMPDERIIVAGLRWDDPDALPVGWYAALEAADGSEAWSATVDPDETFGQLYAAAVGPDAEVAVAGTVDDDNVVVVAEPDGSERWSLVFDAISTAEDAALGVTFAPNGDVLVAGSSTHAYVRRFGADGEELWSQVYGFEEMAGYDLTVTTDGVLVLAGADSSLGSSGRTPVLVGIHPADGAEVWRNYPLGAGVVGRARSVAAGPAGSIAAVGNETAHVLSGDDLWVASYRNR